jgi:hypothetical protein
MSSLNDQNAVAECSKLSIYPQDCQPVVFTQILVAASWVADRERGQWIGRIPRPSLRHCPAIASLGVPLLILKIDGLVNQKVDNSELENDILNACSGVRQNSPYRFFHPFSSAPKKKAAPAVRTETASLWLLPGADQAPGKTIQLITI